MDLPQHLCKNLKFHINFMLTVVTCSVLYIAIVTILWLSGLCHFYILVGGSTIVTQVDAASHIRVCLCQLQCTFHQNVNRNVPLIQHYNSIWIFHSDDTYPYTCLLAVILSTKIYVCTYIEMLYEYVHVVVKGEVVLPCECHEGIFASVISTWRLVISCMTRLLYLWVENSWYALSMRLAGPRSSSSRFGEEKISSSCWESNHNSETPSCSLKFVPMLSIYHAMWAYW